MATKLTQRQADKLIEAAQNAITFTVVGKGDFPADMLRYDLCWPATEADSYKLNVLPQSEGYTEARIVTLKGLKPPTFPRWRSFNWEVMDLT